MPATSALAIIAVNPRPWAADRTFTASSGGSTERARIDTPFSASAWRWWEISSSATRDGGAHVAQKYTSAGCPASPESECSWPSRSRSVKSGAGKG